MPVEIVGFTAAEPLTNKIVTNSATTLTFQVNNRSLKPNTSLNFPSRAPVVLNPFGVTNQLSPGVNANQNNRFECNLPKDPGPCYAYIPRWYYEFTVQQCQMFIYGGCQGNLNNFPAKDECEKMCASKNE